MSGDISLQVATALMQYWFPFMIFLFSVWLVKVNIFD